MRTSCCLLRCAAAIFALMAHAYATAAPTVVAFDVLFGAQSYNVVGSSRTTLPWQITGITAVFSEAITSGGSGSLSGVSASAFTGLGTNALTWDFSALSNADYSLVLAGTGISALSGADGALNGGSNFTQGLNVLFGDFNGDGKVDGADVAGVIAAESQPYNIFADINGDGIVDSADASLIHPATSVPEPTTIALLGVGIVGLRVFRRKQKTRS
jgi:hypothetical protein